MEYFNKGLATLFQPFLRKTFNILLGEFIDENGVNFEDLTLNGIKNLQLDVQKINKRYFENSHLLMEKCQLDSIKIYFSLQKKIQIIIESVQCGLYINEDIAEKEKQQQDELKKNFNKKQNEVEIKIDNNKKILETLQNYQIEIIIRDILVTLKPTRPTIESDYIILHVKEVSVQKNPNKKVQNSKNDTSFIVEIQLQSTSIILQKKKFYDQSMVNQQTQKQRYNIYQQNVTQKFQLEILNKNNVFNITLKGNVNEIVIELNYQILGFLMIFYQKLMNYEQSKLILNENWENLDSLTKSHATYLADKFASSLDQKFEQIFQSFDFKFAQNFGYENSFSNTSNLEQSFKIYGKIIFHQINIVFYDQNEFNNLQMEVKPNYLDDGYLNIFPFENQQIVISDTEFIIKQNIQMVHVRKIQFGNLYKSQNISNEDNKIIQNLNNSSAFLHSLIEENYQINTFFIIDCKEKFQNDNILQDDSILDLEFKKARKTSIQTYQIQKDTQTDDPNMSAVTIKLQNKTFCCLVTHINFFVDQIPSLVENFLKKLNFELENQIQESTFHKNLLKDFDLQMYFKSFQKLNHTKVISDLKNRFKDIKKRNSLIFDLPFNIIFCVRNFHIQQNQQQNCHLLKLLNFQLNLVDLNKMNPKSEKQIMNLEKLNFLDQIEFININSILSNYDSNVNECNITTTFNQFQGTIDISYMFDLIQSFELKVQQKKNIFQIITKSIEFLKEQQDELTGIYEIDQQKITINNLLSEIAIELMPVIKFCTIFKGIIRNINIQIIDTGEKVLSHLNDYLYEPMNNNNFFKDLDYSQISEKRYDQINLLLINSDSIDFVINDQSQKIQIKNFNAKSINIWSNQNQDYLFEFNIDNIIAKNQRDDLQVQINLLSFRVDSTQKRINILKNMFESYLEIFFERLPLNHFQQSTSSQKTQKVVELQVNSVEIIFLDYLINLKVCINNIKLNHEESYIPYVQISKSNYALQSEQNILELHSFYNSIKQKQAKIKNIGVYLNIQLLKTLNEFFQSYQKNLNLFQQVYVKYRQQQLRQEDSDIKEQEDKFQSFVTQEQQIVQPFGNFEVVGKFWDIFMSFKDTVDKKNDQNDIQQILKLFLKDQGQENLIENQFFVDEIKIQLLDDVIESEYIFSIQKLCICKSQFLVGFLDKFEVLIKQDYNQDVIIRNTGDNLAVKFLLEQGSQMNTYLGLGTLNLDGKQKLWEILDKRLKIFLKDYYKSKKEEQQIQSNFELINSDISQTIGEVIIDAFKICIDIAQQQLILEIEETNSMEIVEDEKFIEDVIQLLIQKILKAVKTSCLQIRFLSGIRIILFFFWRIFTFIFLRRNVLNINRGFYKLMKDKISSNLNY